MVRPISDDDLGLRVLCNGSLSSQRSHPVDIVAVHGMGAHPDDTWRKKVGDDSSVYVNWLTDPRLLPSVVPGARIMRYGYDSRWFGEAVIKTRTSEISQQFLFELKELREDAHRPLIFIAHSFGGLVVLQTLVHAHMEPDRWPGVYDSTVGLVFLGTPFRGTHDSLSQGQILALAYELFAGSPVHGENLNILRAGGGSLIDLVDTYLRIARQGTMPRVACFYEQRASPVGAILGRDIRKKTLKEIPDVILVNESSGCLDLSASTDKYPLPRNHFDIQKFSKPNELGFKIIRSVIQEIVERQLQLANSVTQPINPEPRNPSRQLIVQKSFLFTSLTKDKIHILPNDASYWRHLTVASHKIYEKVYDNCKDHRGMVSFPNFLQQIPPSTISSSTVKTVWSRLLNDKSDILNSVHPKGFTMATLYMLHIETFLLERPRDDNKEVGVHTTRRKLLKRYGNWVHCRCDGKCGLEWNFGNDIGMHKGGTEKKCKMLKLYNKWLIFIPISITKELEFKRLTEEDWQNSLA